MKILDHILNVEKALGEVKSHPMCFKIEDDGKTYLVVFPEGDFAVDGIRINYSVMGKYRALQKMLVKMEYYWVSSYPAYERK